MSKSHTDGIDHRERSTEVEVRSRADGTGSDDSMSARRLWKGRKYSLWSLIEGCVD